MVYKKTEHDNLLDKIFKRVGIKSSLETNQCMLLQEEEVNQNSNKTLKLVTKTLQHIAISKNNIVACFAPSTLVSHLLIQGE